ncbi:ABC transporter permease [Streptococcus macacae]|uniref:ABC transporter, permease protein n=1 Tax=Streptococcus macacae NCTC 11558 TaxID=764298 RepID=G5JW94_9STRE|nr:ABC transporter permease [Streptococcus macacae]EHJ51917.1 ABC transporter, permease protein [Streptococcus macacae NCTC 11558]SUN77749.1 oligopeptide ABC transporter permease [Streptococcus macacae NCTC 11558]
MADKNRKFILVGKKDILAPEKIEERPLSFSKQIWQELKKNKLSIIALAFLTLLIVFSLISPLLVSQKEANSFNPDKVSTYRNLPPNSGLGIPGWNGVFKIPGSNVASDVYKEQSVPDNKIYVFGTDNLGRSLGKRLIVGIRISLFVALAATCLDLLLGVTYGLISGYIGGAVDTFMQRIIEIISAVPNLIIVTMLGLLFGKGIFAIIFSIGLTGWVAMARQVRNMTLSYKERDSILAAKVLGVSGPKIALRHILPNISGVIIVQVMMTIPSAIMYEAVLSAINLGIKPPTSSLGSLIADAQENLQYYPYQVILPSLILVLISLAFIILGDGLRDAFDPKSDRY